MRSEVRSVRRGAIPYRALKVILRVIKKARWNLKKPKISDLKTYDIPSP